MVRPITCAVETSAVQHGVVGELRNDPGERELKPDHRREHRVDELDSLLPALVGGAADDRVHEAEEGEVAGGLGDPGAEAVRPLEGDEDRPGRGHREGRDQPAVAAVLVPAAKLPQAPARRRARPPARGLQKPSRTIIAPPPETAPPAPSGGGSGGPGRGCSSWRNRGRIRASGARPRRRRRRGS